MHTWPVHTCAVIRQRGPLCSALPGDWNPSTLSTVQFPPRCTPPKPSRHTRANRHARDVTARLHTCLVARVAARHTCAPHVPLLSLPSVPPVRPRCCPPRHVRGKSPAVHHHPDTPSVHSNLSRASTPFPLLSLISAPNTHCIHPPTHCTIRKAKPKIGTLESLFSFTSPPRTPSSKIVYLWVTSSPPHPLPPSQKIPSLFPDASHKHVTEKGKEKGG